MAFNFRDNAYWLDRATVESSALLACSRNSDFNLFKADGTAQKFAPNVPAFSFGGLEVWKQVRNYLNWTRNFGQVSTGWSITKSSGEGTNPVLTTDQLGPDGTLTAQRVVFDIGAGTGALDFSQFGQQVGVSDSDSVCHVIGACSFDGGTHDLFLSDTGVSTSTIAIIKVSPEWRLYKFVTTRVGRSVARLTIGLRGDLPTSKHADVLLWEPGVLSGDGEYPFVIPAPGNTADGLKLADSVTIPDFASKAAALGFASGFGVKAVIDLARLNASGNRTVFMAGEDSNNSVRVFISPTNEMRLAVNAGGVQVLNINAGGFASIGTKQIEARVENGNFSLQATGLPGVVNAGAYALPALSALHLGSNIGGGNELNGTLRELQLWRSAA